MLDEVKKEMINLSEVVHKFAFDIVFFPLQEQISHLHEMEVCCFGLMQNKKGTDLGWTQMSSQATTRGGYLGTLGCAWWHSLGGGQPSSNRGDETNQWGFFSCKASHSKHIRPRAGSE